MEKVTYVKRVVTKSLEGRPLLPLKKMSGLWVMIVTLFFCSNALAPNKTSAQLDPTSLKDKEISGLTVSSLKEDSELRNKLLLAHVVPPNHFPSAYPAPSSKKPYLCPLPNKLRKQAVRLEVTGAELVCSGSECSHYRQGCRLEIKYRLSSDYRAESDIDTWVTCRAKLSYQISHGYHLISERYSNPICHTLHKMSAVNSKVVLGFQFSPYEEVVDAQVDSIQCHLENSRVLPDSPLN